MKKTNLALILGLGLMAATQASASVYQYNPTTITQGGNIGTVGTITDFNASFNDATDQFSWSSTIEDGAADGFWMVMSSGPNPKGHANEYTILYGDTVNSRLTAYVYKGLNSSNSWNNGQFIGSYGLSSSTSGNATTFSFNIDASSINQAAPPIIDAAGNQTGTGFTLAGPTDIWQGLTIGPDTAGVWYHPVVLDTSPGNLQYAANGSLWDFAYTASSWNDVANQPVTPGGPSGVPEPNTLVLLLGAGLIGAGMKRKRQPQQQAGMLKLAI